MGRTFNLAGYDRSNLIEQIVAAMNRRRDSIELEFAPHTGPYEWQLADAALGVIEGLRTPKHAAAEGEQQ